MFMMTGGAAPVPCSSRCRVCGSTSVAPAGVVEYFQGFPAEVADCASCGCRFTPHDSSVHEAFHRSGAISYYADYRDLAAETARLFAAGDRAGLRGYLSSVAEKYRFVLDLAGKLPTGAHCLEIGCSRGYLTSSLILDGKNVLGVDVSAEAVSAAQGHFGDHFALAGSERESSSGPYDFIYHVGVIGCVADPLALSRRLMEKLKPGGLLAFNAPNRDACVLRGQLWLDSAPPPDLVTLFPPGFWKRQFGDCARVEERVEHRSPEESFRLLLAKALGPRWRKPLAQPLAASRERRVWMQSGGTGWSSVERVANKLARITSMNRLVGPVPSDFGLFVTLKRN